MECSECGTKEGDIKEYVLLFGTEHKGKKIFNATYERHMCKECVCANINLLKKELEFLVDNENINTQKDKLVIQIDKEFEVV